MSSGHGRPWSRASGRAPRRGERPGPLRYLIAIKQEHLLGQLFENVFVPVTGHEELTEARTPEVVRRRTW